MYDYTGFAISKIGLFARPDAVELTSFIMAAPRFRNAEDSETWLTRACVQVKLGKGSND